MKFCIKLASLLVLLHITCGKLPLEDATATINQLFSYKIDHNDFPNAQIKVSEAGKDILPSWLEFDSAANVLFGIPSIKDRGTYILAVGQEMFAVTVSEKTKYQVAQPAIIGEQTLCKAHDSITVVYVKINADTDTFSPDMKANLVNSISSHLSLKPDHISVSAKPTDLVDSSRALLTRGGDTPSDDNLSVLSWIVGCGTVKSYHMDILEKLESTAKDGSLGKLLQTGVSGWQVQSNQPKVLTKRRLKRNVVVTQTLTPTVPTEPPTTTTKPATTTTKTTATTATTAAPVTTPRAVETTRRTVSVTAAQKTTKKPTANHPPVFDNSRVPTEIPAMQGQLVRWTLPDRLVTDPEDEEITFSISSNLNRQWLVTKEFSNNWEVVGFSWNVGPSELLTLTAKDESGGKATVQLNIKHSQRDKSSLTQKYTLKIRQNEILSSSSLFLALTLQDSAFIEDFKLVSQDSNGGMMTVVIGDNRARQNTCPTNANTNTLNALREMVGKEISLKGNDEDKLYISAISSVKPISPCVDNKPKVNKDKIAMYQPLEVALGELYESVLPMDLFTDVEDGDLSKMGINLLVDSKVDADGWISLDLKSRKLQALTWDTPDSESQFSLVATDSNDGSTEVAVQVMVKDNSDKVTQTNLVTLTIDAKYSIFANSHSNQIELYKKIRNAFPGSVVTLKSVKKGSIVAQFSLRNSQQPAMLDSCPSGDLESYKKALFDGNEVNKNFIKQLGSYKLSKVDFLAVEICADAVKAQTASIKEPVDKEEDSEPGNNLVMIIIIVVVILIIVIAVVVVVIVCVKKRNAAKAKASRQNGNDIEKRVPVVMDEEMKSLNRPENQPLMDSSDVSFKQTPAPPAYHGEEDYQPDTPPVSEPDDERRILDRSP